MTKPTITITDSSGNTISGLRLNQGETATIRIYTDTAGAIVLNAVRGDFREIALTGEDESTARTNGQELIDEGIIEGSKTGATWQNIGGFDNALYLGNIAAGSYATAMIRIKEDTTLSTIGLTAIGFAVRLGGYASTPFTTTPPAEPSAAPDAAFTTAPI